MNQNAGIQHPRAGPEEMERAAREAGLHARVEVSPSPEALRARIRQLIDEGCERIGVAGGDGTVHHAVQELACTKTALGIIAQGTANNFATALRLPLDLPTALQVLKDGEPRSVDLGRARGEYFTEAAGVGLFADALAIYGAGTNKSFFKGLYAMLRVVLSLRARRLRLTVDGERRAERAVLCMAANTYRMGAAMPVAPGAKLTDGELDVVMIGDLTRAEAIPYYRAFRAQLHLSLPKVSTFRAREITISSRRKMNVHCDDRLIGGTPVTITTEPGALRVLVDRL
jgi:YegS/Rv2252/BmrU family lipid kinase